MPAPSTIPPAATTGIGTSIAPSSSSSGTSPSSNEPRNVPLCPPASAPWATIPSTPVLARTSASSAVVAVPSTAIPRSCNGCGSTSPNVKLNTAGRSSSTTSSTPSRR